MKKMIKKEDGSIGIGSLIIFIALMVVAAIAAAVIVSTVSSMRDRAYGAANSADNLVTGNIWDVHCVGYRSGTTEPINKIEISFSVVSNSVDLNTTLIEFAINSSAPIYYTLNIANPSTPTTSHFSASVSAFQGNTESWDPAHGKYWVSPGQLIVVTILLPNDAQIHPGQNAVLTIVPKPGAPYEHTIVAPADFGSNLAIEL